MDLDSLRARKAQLSGELQQLELQGQRILGAMLLCDELIGQFDEADSADASVSSNKFGIKQERHDGTVKAG